MSPISTGPDEQDADGISTGEAAVDETLEASFPASDPPSWTLGVEAEHQAAESDGEDDGRGDLGRE